MAIEIVDFPNKTGGFSHYYVNVHQRVYGILGQLALDDHTMI